jgi:hypothetical protein
VEHHLVDGWSAWVDARELMGAEGQPRVLDHGAPTLPLDQQPATSVHPTLATKEQRPALGSVSWSKSRRLRLVVSLALCIASPLIYILGT